jgi:hypothetical protein
MPLSKTLTTLFPLFARRKSAAEKLEEAINNRNARKVKRLIRRGVSANTKEKYGDPVLFSACCPTTRGDVLLPEQTEIVKILLDNGADPNGPAARSGLHPLDLAGPQCRELLLAKGAVHSDKYLANEEYKRLHGPFVSIPVFEARITTN